MSHLRVKTTYSAQGANGTTETVCLYCDHNQIIDTVTFYDGSGAVARMQFHEWESGNDLWDAMNRLMAPFKEAWGGALKDGVEYWYGGVFLLP